jgi:hypothetical protein
VISARRERTLMAAYGFWLATHAGRSGYEG